MNSLCSKPACSRHAVKVLRLAVRGERIEHAFCAQHFREFAGKLADLCGWGASGDLVTITIEQGGLPPANEQSSKAAHSEPAPGLLFPRGGYR